MSETTSKQAQAVGEDDELQITSKKKVYELFETGVQIPGVIVGWKKMLDVPTKYGLKDKVMVKILTDLVDSDGDQMTAVQSFTASMDEKSHLRKFVKSVLGYDPGDTYNLKLMVGMNRNFVFETNEGKDGREFSNVSAVLKATTKVSIPDDYEAFRADDKDKKTAKPPVRRRVATPVVEEELETAGVEKI
jgi:hypothetical protein